MTNSLRFSHGRLLSRAFSALPRDTTMTPISTSRGSQLLSLLGATQLSNYVIGCDDCPDHDKEKSLGIVDGQYAYMDRQPFISYLLAMLL